MVNEKHISKRVQGLQQKYHEELGRDDHKAALPLLRELDELVGGNPNVLYDLACVLSRLGKESEALDALRRSAKSGFFMWEHIQKDSDLEAIRELPETTEIIALIKGNAERFHKGLEDPYAAATAVPCPTAKSVKGILKFYAKKRIHLQKHGRYLGPWLSTSIILPFGDN